MADHLHVGAYRFTVHLSGGPPPAIVTADSREEAKGRIERYYDSDEVRAVKITGGPSAEELARMRNNLLS